MSIIQWNQDYSVDVFEMDAQHKKIVELVNKLYSAMSQAGGKEALKDVVDELVAYTQYHFSSEEKLMQKHGFYADQFYQHQQNHMNLTKKVAALKEKLQSGQHVSAISVGNFLKDWLTQHIQQEDKQYGLYINAHAVS